MSTTKIRLPKLKIGKKVGYLLLVIALVLIIRDPVGSAEAVRPVLVALGVAGGGH